MYFYLLNHYTTRARFVIKNENEMNLNTKYYTFQHQAKTREMI